MTIVRLVKHPYEGFKLLSENTYVKKESPVEKKDFGTALGAAQEKAENALKESTVNLSKMMGRRNNRIRIEREINHTKNNLFAE